MSRVAGAYSRAGGPDPAVDLFDEPDFPRGDALSEFDRATAIAKDRPVPFETIDDAEAMTVPANPVLSRSSAPAHGRAGEAAISARAPSVPLRERNQLVQQNLSGLVERVFLPVSGEPRRSIAFAAVGGSGDSGSIAATAAEMLAERTSRTVCVVDANFRSPSLQVRFGLTGGSGFAEALASDVPLVESARRLQRNLWVLPAGLATRPPLFTTAAARVRIAQFLAQFDHVILNVGPVEPGSDVAALLRLVGGVIVVIAADSTRRETARRVTQSLSESGVSVIGAVLTNRRLPIPDALFRLF